jgi:hypothetical protein
LLKTQAAVESSTVMAAKGGAIAMPTNLRRILRSPSASLDALRGQIASARFFDHLKKDCY